MRGGLLAPLRMSAATTARHEGAPGAFRVEPDPRDA
jgi:hypothetical protein